MYFLPHMGGMLVKNPLVDKTDLSSVTSVHMTGAPTGSALQQLIIDKLPKSAHVGNCEYFMGFFSQLCINTGKHVCATMLPKFYGKLCSTRTKKLFCLKCVTILQV